jgi:AcrR family transcriptional regulator
VADQERGVRGSYRGHATRRALLEAAAAVFGEVGFDKAGVSEVASRAGTSVGGLYHHFTGKADLFRSLFEDFQHRQQDRTYKAVAAARAAGEGDPARLMTVAARAYLEGCISEQSTARLFFGGDGPPGFDQELRERLWEWTDRNVALYRKAEEPVDEALLMVVTGAAVLAVTQLVNEPDPERALRISGEVIAVLERLAPDRSAAQSGVE